jgi:multidrug resistance efflux pump
MTVPDQEPRLSNRANLLVIGLGVALLLAAFGVILYALTTRSRDAVVDADFIEINSPINGRLMELSEDMGAEVRAGAPLALVQNSRASKADVQALRTALDTAEAALLRSTRELEEQQKLMSEFQLDARSQQQLERARSSNELDELKADLARERQELGFAERNLARQEQLYRDGAVAQNVVDRARTSVETNREQVRALQARIRAQSNRVEAAERNLNLDRTRGGTDPLPRLQDARLRLAQLKGEHDAAERRVKGLEAQLETANTLYKQQSDVWLDAPIDAVIWRVLARVGDTLRADQPVLRLVNCRTRWVTTYVSEADLKRLKIGSRTRIDLIGEELDLRGKVDLIRSGVGRLSGSNDEPVPLPINLARESQVRVRIDSDVPAPPRKLCFVGYSARVIFL